MMFLTPSRIKQSLSTMKFYSFLFMLSILIVICYELYVLGKVSSVNSVFIVPQVAQNVGTFQESRQETSKILATNASSLNWETNIDFVIAWSGLPKSLANGTDVSRERYNNELPYLLRSISLNAPWVRKIWILVNTGVVPPDERMIPSSIINRTTVLDRCSYMPEGTCPTRNSHAVKAFAYRIPGLAEHFVIGDDDIFLGRPITPSHFYEAGKPYVWRKKPSWGYFRWKEFHRIYVDPSIVSFRTPNSSSPSPHFWYPQLKSVCKSLDMQFFEFFQFVGSHTEGRFSSRAKGVSDEHNSQEECYVGIANWELLRTGRGVYKEIDSKHPEWWDEVVIAEWGFKKAINDRSIFMNVNDRFSKDEETYERQIKWFQSAMEIMFPS